jgi:glycosyltransferase involved in cell wall biosynthesis
LVPGLLRKMDAGIVCFQPLPFCRVALPNKIFEYMAAALPVVASNFPLWREIIEGNSCGLCVDPEDPNDIAQAVRYLYGHPEERRKMGENGYRAVREKYNWEKEGEKLVALYKSLLEDKEV